MSRTLVLEDSESNKQCEKKNDANGNGIYEKNENEAKGMET